MVTQSELLQNPIKKVGMFSPVLQRFIPTRSLRMSHQTAQLRGKIPFFFPRGAEDGAVPTGMVGKTPPCDQPNFRDQII